MFVLQVAAHVKATNLSCHQESVDALMEARPTMKACLAELCRKTHESAVACDLWVVCDRLLVVAYCTAAKPARGSDCWARCYMSELLGANATSSTTGMTSDEITKLWMVPFEAESAGGCPNLFESLPR